MQTLLLFTRYPRPGCCKTRLIPALGAKGAAELARAFLLDLAERLARADLGPARRIICFDPPHARARFRALLARPAVILRRFELLPQSGGALGQRLAAALRNVSGKMNASPVAFIGSDAPDLPTASLSAGFKHAARGRAYLQLALDGGYVLLVVPAGTPPAIFSRIDWSSARTGRQQAQRIRAAGIQVVIAKRRWRDVDEATDLIALKKRSSRAAPRTQRYLAGWPTVASASRPMSSHH